MFDPTLQFQPHQTSCQFIVYVHVHSIKGFLEIEFRGENACVWNLTRHILILTWHCSFLALVHPLSETVSGA